MKTLIFLWILGSGAALAAGDAITARSRQLAQAVDAYHRGDAARAMAVLVRLNTADPLDDDVAYWMARLHHLAGRHQEALDLLEGRQGMNMPGCRFRVLEARALVASGQEDNALGRLVPCVDSPDPEQPLVFALAGLLSLKHGEQAEGVELILQAGGNPWAVMDPPLREGWPEAENVRVMHVLEPMDAEIHVVMAGVAWRVDLKTGLARRTGSGVPLQSPVVGHADEVQRTELAPCGEGHVWSSPSEPLAGGGPGVFRTLDGEVVRVASSPGQGVDDRPSCAGEEVWFVRRVSGHSAVISVRPGEDWAWSPEKGGLASVDARKGQNGETQLLMGWVIDGKVGVWTTSAVPFEPVKLLEEEALAPRWLP